jgi:hypothetical protein
VVGLLSQQLVWLGAAAMGEGCCDKAVQFNSKRSFDGLTDVQGVVIGFASVDTSLGDDSSMLPIRTLFWTESPFTFAAERPGVCKNIEWYWLLVELS